VSVSIGKQSADIALGVDSSLEALSGKAEDNYDNQGAGDQGIMFGFACVETKDLMPLPIKIAHSLSERLAKVRHEGVVDFLRPDGKTQVTIGYEGDRPVSVQTVVVSTQHNPGISHGDISSAIAQFVIAPVLAEFGFDSSQSKLLINPTGNFVIGGPQGDAGLTGRKIIIDTYGGYSRHGGGAFSGKDPSKVDRSAAYAMRWVAKCRLPMQSESQGQSACMWNALAPTLLIIPLLKRPCLRFSISDHEQSLIRLISSDQSMVPLQLMVTSVETYLSSLGREQTRLLTCSQPQVCNAFSRQSSIQLSTSSVG
jgi:hypothetical protein